MLSTFQTVFLQCKIVAIPTFMLYTTCKSLSNEVLHDILLQGGSFLPEVKSKTVGQRAMKLLAVKVGILKKCLSLWLLQPECVKACEVRV